MYMDQVGMFIIDDLFIYAFSGDPEAWITWIAIPLVIDLSIIWFYYASGHEI